MISYLVLIVTVGGIVAIGLAMFRDIDLLREEADREALLDELWADDDLLERAA